MKVEDRRFVCESKTNHCLQCVKYLGLDKVQIQFYIKVLAKKGKRLLYAPSLSYGLVERVCRWGLSGLRTFFGCLVSFIGFVTSVLRFPSNDLSLGQFMVKPLFHQAIEFIPHYAISGFHNSFKTLLFLENRSGLVIRGTMRYLLCNQIYKY
jgi:hypothetical protein